MVDQLDAIGVDIYANVTVKAADQEIKALQSRTSKKTVRIGVDFIQGQLEAMDAKINALADQKRQILVDIKWEPTATRKGQFQRDIQKALNAGPPVTVKTTLDLGASKQKATWRQEIKDALSGIVIDDVEVKGKWMGLINAPEELVIPVRGAAQAGQTAANAKAAQPVAPLLKESSGQWLGGGRILKVFVTNWQGGGGAGVASHEPSGPPSASAAQPSAVLEAPVTTKSGSSKTTGGAAGTVRETEEVTTSSKKTTEVKPSAPIAVVPAKTTVPIVPLAKQTSVLPSAGKVTQLEPGAASGAPVLMGRHAGGGGDIVSAQLQQILDTEAEAAKRVPENAKTFFKEMGIKLSAASVKNPAGKKIIQAKFGDLQNVPEVVQQGAPIITADFDNMKLPRKRSPFTSGMLNAMEIDPKGKRADILKQVQDKITTAIDSFNLANTPQMSVEDVLASFFGDAARPEHENPAVRPGKKGQSVANPKSAFKLHGGTGSRLTQSQVRARNALNVIMNEEFRHDVSDLPMDEQLQLASHPNRMQYATGSEEALAAAARRGKVAAARGELFEQMEAGTDPFHEQVAAMEHLTDTFLGGVQEIGPNKANPRDLALRAADELDTVFRDMQKANPKFSRTLQNVRSGKQPTTSTEMAVERALAAVGTTRSVLGRNIALDINDPTSPKAAAGGLANFWAEKDIAQMDANRQRAETSATMKALEDYIGIAGLPPSSVETTTAEGVRQKLQFVRAPQRRMLVKHPITGDMVGKDFPEDPTNPSVREQAMAEFTGPTIEQRGNYMYEFQQAVLKRRDERPRLEAAQKELEAGGPKLDRIAARTKTKLNPGGITRRQELEAFVDKGLTQLPQPKAHELEGLFAGIDTTVMNQEPWFQGLQGMLRAAQEDIDKAIARASGAPKHKMRRDKPLDSIDTHKRMEAISAQLQGPMSGDLEEKLRLEFDQLQRSANLDTSRSSQLDREHDQLLTELHGRPGKGKVEAIPAAVGLRRLALPREIDLKKAEQLEAEADEMRAAMKDPFGTVPIQGGDEAITLKLARASALRAKHEIRNPELSPYLQQLLAGDDEAGEGPGATRRRSNDPLLSVPTGSRRMKETIAALEGITSPQMASGILKRTTSETTQAEAQAALLYKQGVRAFDGKLIGGGGGVQQVFVTNFKEISALVAKGAASQQGVSPRAGLPATAAASSVVPLGAPSATATAAANRMFQGDIPFGIDPRVIEALEEGADSLEVAKGKAETISVGREKLKRTGELVTSRSPTVAAGEAIQALLGGRPEVVTAIQEAGSLRTEQAAILRKARVREEVTLPRLAIQQAALAPDDQRGHARVQRQIQDAQLLGAFEKKRFEDIEDALPAIEDQFKGVNPVLRSFTSLTIGAIGGTLLFGATLQAAQAGIQLLSTVMKPGIDLMTNYGEVTTATSKSLGQLVRQSAGSAQAGVASALFESGAPPNFSFRPEIERAGQVGAGLSALEEQRQLLQTGINFRLNPQAGVTFPVGGGPFGLAGTNSALREFKNTLEGVFPGEGLVQPPRAFQDTERDKLIVEAINDGFSEVGIKVVSQEEAGLTDAEAEAQRTSIGRIKSERDFLGGENVSTLVANQLRDRGLVVVGANTGKAVTGADFEGALGGQIIEATKKSAQLFVEAQEPQIQAQRAVLQEQRVLNDRLGPVQVAMSAFTQPVLPAGTSIPVGINLPGLPQGPTAASRSNVQQLNQLKAQGQQTILDIVGDSFPDRLPAVTSELQEINALSDHLADIQIDLISQQQAHTVHSFNNQLIITQRTMEDLRALSGQSGGSAFGGMQRDLLMANRQLQALGLESSRISLGINERQLNLAEGLAGLGVAGETPEERALRLRATREELADQRRLLDIQGQSLTIQGQTLPVSFKVEDISIDRNYRDAVRSFNLLKEEIQIQANTAQAEDEIRGLSALLEYKVSQLNHDLQAGVGDLNIEMEVYQSAVAATLGDWRTTRKVVGDIVDTLRGTGVDLGGSGTGDGGSHDSGGSGGGYATGGLFNTSGPVTMTVGEAGNETVAVLRNPRNMLAALGSGGAGGQVVNVNVTGNTVRSDQDLNELIRRVTNEVQYSLAQQSALRGLRSPL